MTQRHPVKPVPVFWEPAFWDMSEYQASTNAPSTALGLAPATAGRGGEPFGLSSPQPGRAVAAAPAARRRWCWSSWRPGLGQHRPEGDHPPKRPFSWMAKTKGHFIHRRGHFRGWRRRNRSSSTKKGVFVDEIGGRRWRDGRSLCHPRHRKRGDRNGGERQRTE